MRAEELEARLTAPYKVAYSVGVRVAGKRRLVQTARLCPRRVCGCAHGARTSCCMGGRRLEGAEPYVNGAGGLGKTDGGIYVAKFVSYTQVYETLL